MLSSFHDCVSTCILCIHLVARVGGRTANAVVPWLLLWSACLTQRAREDWLIHAFDYGSQIIFSCSFWQYTNYIPHQCHHWWGSFFDHQYHRQRRHFRHIQCLGIPTCAVSAYYYATTTTSGTEKLWLLPAAAAIRPTTSRTGCSITKRGEKKTIAWNDSSRRSYRRPLFKTSRKEKNNRMRHIER